MDVTIAIATWNAEKNIERVLDALPQDVPLIVIDNESKDGTQAILEKRGIKFTTFPHTGKQWPDVYTAYKTLAGLVKTEYIFILDHDVALNNSDDIQKAYDYFKTLEKAGAVAINYGGSPSHPQMGASLWKTEILNSFDWVSDGSGKCGCTYAKEQLSKLGLEFVYAPDLKATHLKIGRMLDAPDMLTSAIVKTGLKTYRVPQLKVYQDFNTKKQVTVITGMDDVDIEVLQNEINFHRLELNKRISLRDNILNSQKKEV